MAALLGMTLIVGPAIGQGITSKGDEFLAALRKSNGGDAVRIVEDSGFTVVNHRGDDGSTALHIVTLTRDRNWVEFLLSNGADKDAADKKGDTPLILAARTGFGDGLTQLLRKRATIDKANRQGETALIVAVQQRHAAIVTTLLASGADPDKRDFAAGFSARDYAKRDSRTKDMLKLIESAKPTVSPSPPVR